MKSKKQLFLFLNKEFNKKLDLDSDGVTNETYGNSSRIYLWGIKKIYGIPRKELENKIIDAGFKVNQNWNKGADSTEVSVSYFKGWHWDE